jgi:membrane associated rhomboid family serine protease
MSVRKVRDALVLMGTFIALIWILQVFNWADGYRLDLQFGILPQHLSRLPDIFTAPFLHFSWQHIEGNTVPLFVLGVLAAYRGIGKFLLVTLIVTVVSGLAVLLFQSGNELTVGASGLIFGYFGYVLIRGFFDRNLVDIGVGVVAGLLYWTILQVAIPGTPGISWIGHLGGLFGGVLAAWVLRTRTPAGVTAAGWTTGLGSGRLGGRLTRGSSADVGDGGGSGAAGGRADGGRADGQGRGAPGRDAGSRGAPGRGAPGSPPAPGDHPGSRAAADLLRELDDMGL